MKIHFLSVGLQGGFPTQHRTPFAWYWRTGKLAFHGDIESYFDLEKHQAILGYLYVGTPTGKQKTIPTMQVDEYVETWN